MSTHKCKGTHTHNRKTQCMTDPVKLCNWNSVLLLHTQTHTHTHTEREREKMRWCCRRLKCFSPAGLPALCNRCHPTHRPRPHDNGMFRKRCHPTHRPRPHDNGMFRKRCFFRFQKVSHPHDNVLRAHPLPHGNAKASENAVASCLVLKSHFLHNRCCKL